MRRIEFQGKSTTRWYYIDRFMSICPSGSGARYNRYMGKRKKVLFLITKTNWGGAQQYVHDLAAHLPKERFEVMVGGGGNGALFAKLRASGIRTISVRGLQRDIGVIPEWRAFWEIVRLLKQEQPDVVHLNSSKAAGLGALAAFVFKFLNLEIFKPAVIFTVHGWGFSEDRPWWQCAAIFIASWTTCLLCDRVIVLGTQEEAAALRFLPRKKVVRIPHGLSPLPLASRTEARAFFASRIGRAIPDNVPVIGTIAELTKNKDLPSLVSAASLLKSDLNNFLVLIVGEGEERAHLERRIADAGLGDHVFLAGFVPDAVRFLPGLDMFVLPSVKEGLPYALMSAMAAGLPVVATRVGNIPDLIAEGEDGMLVAPKDATGLSAAIRRLAASPAQRQRLGGNARRKIETAFPFSAMMERTISLYS